MEKSKTKKYEGQEVFVGVDVHKRTYSVCCILGEREYKSQSVPADPQKLINHLLKKFPGATYSLAYEAGFCGFRLYDELTECGMTCLVVHAADVVTTDKEKRRKTDPSDSRKLARALRGGLLSGIRVPNGEDRALQSLTRHREQLVKDQVRIQNQIKSHLDYHGVDIPVDYQGNKWSKRFVEWLSTSTGMTGYLAYVLNSHLVRYKAIMAWIEEVNKEMKKASKSEEYVDDIGYLKSVPGISVTNALIFRAEVGSIEHYSSQDRLASFAGLTPGSRSSGDKVISTGLDHRGRGRVRKMLVEASWVAIRKDTDLQEKYGRYKQRMGAAKAIIRIARQLLNRIYRLLNEQRNYYLPSAA